MIFCFCNIIKEIVMFKEEKIIMFMVLGFDCDLNLMNKFMVSDIVVEVVYVVI